LEGATRGFLEVIETRQDKVLAYFARRRPIFKIALAHFRALLTLMDLRAYRGIVSIQISTTSVLNGQISELKAEISRLRQELEQHEKELTVLESAVRRLSNKHKQDTPQKAFGSTRSPVLRFKSISLPRAVRAILREHGKPMRIQDVLSALHKAGRKEVDSKSLNSALGALVQRGKVSHPGIGIYAYAGYPGYRQDSSPQVTKDTGVQDRQHRSVQRDLAFPQR
jgi:hypothetical protein